MDRVLQEKAKGRQRRDNGILETPTQGKQDRGFTDWQMIKHIIAVTAPESFQLACLARSIHAESQLMLPFADYQMDSQRDVYDFPEAYYIDRENNVMLTTFNVFRRQMRAISKNTEDLMLNWNKARVHTESKASETKAYYLTACEFLRLCSMFREELRWPDWIPLDPGARCGPHVFKTFDLDSMQTKCALRWGSTECLLIHADMSESLNVAGLANQFIPVFKHRIRSNWNECIARWTQSFDDVRHSSTLEIFKVVGSNGLFCNDRTAELLRGSGLAPLTYATRRFKVLDS